MRPPNPSQAGPRQVRSAKAAPAKPDAEDAGGMRIAKAIARAGLCSRRDAERWIEEGRVSVDGKTLTSPALVVTGSEKILVDGKALPQPDGVRLWRYHKPKGLVTTHKDPEGRETVFDKLPDSMPRVISVGRLDYNSEGLLLLTNDGALARHMELPSTAWIRRYRARAWGNVTEEQLEALSKGVTVEGVHYAPMDVRLDREQGDNVWLTIGLREGKNREVRNVLASLGMTVNRLIRTSYGPFQLQDLKPGEVQEVDRRVLRDQMGPQHAGALGLTGRAPETKEREKPRIRMPSKQVTKPEARRTPRPGAKPAAGRPKRSPR
jgi:23S rRNA pseudouridine2605 synthase